MENHQGYITKDSWKMFIKFCLEDKDLNSLIKKRKMKGQTCGVIDHNTVKIIANRLSSKIRIGQHPEFFIWIKDAFVECSFNNHDFVYKFV